jgi:hypothetical protein
MIVLPAFACALVLQFGYVLPEGYVCKHRGYIPSGPVKSPPSIPLRAPATIIGNRHQN